MTFDELVHEEFNKLRIQFIGYADILDADELEIALQYLQRLHEAYHPQLKGNHVTTP